MNFKDGMTIAFNSGGEVLLASPGPFLPEGTINNEFLFVGFDVEIGEGLCA